MNIKNTGMVTLISILLAGCALTPEQKAATKCGLVGAAIGGITGAGIAALKGALTGGINKKEIAIGAAAGTVVGGVSGAILCYIKATHKNEETYNYQDTQKRIKYSSKQGDKVAIESIKVEPSIVKQGVNQELKLTATYYVMTPNKDNDVDVIEQWGVDANSTDVPTKIPQGTRKSFTTIPLPADAEKGKHTIWLIVKYADKTSQKITKEFTIE
jgi:hypothetical protein